MADDSAPPPPPDSDLSPKPRADDSDDDDKPRRGRKNSDSDDDRKPRGARSDSDDDAPPPATAPEPPKPAPAPAPAPTPAAAPAATPKPVPPVPPAKKVTPPPPPPKAGGSSAAAAPVSPNNASATPSSPTNSAAAKLPTPPAPPAKPAAPKLPAVPPKPATPAASSSSSSSSSASSTSAAAASSSSAAEEAPASPKAEAPASPKADAPASPKAEADASAAPAATAKPAAAAATKEADSEPHTPKSKTDSKFDSKTESRNSNSDLRAATAGAGAAATDAKAAPKPSAGGSLSVATAGARGPLRSSTPSANADDDDDSKTIAYVPRTAAASVSVNAAVSPKSPTPVSPTGAAAATFGAAASAAAAPKPGAGKQKEMDPKKREAAFELQRGHNFTKYNKVKKGQRRMVWLTVAMDDLCWGDENTKDRTAVNGYMAVKDVLSILDGCVGAKTPEHAFTLVGAKQTLSLEADSKEQRATWLDAFRTFSGIVDQSKLASAEAMMSAAEETANFEEAKKLCVTGYAFQKIKHGKAQKRDVWVGDDLVSVHWAEPNAQRKKISGSLAIADILSVAAGCQGAVDQRRAFTIITSDRSLDLEAADVVTREVWLSAINILYRKKRNQPVPSQYLLSTARNSVSARANEKKEYTLSGQAKADHEAALKLLVEGVTVNKYKNKKPKKRVIWVNPSGDLVYWGEQDKLGTRKTNGQIALKEVTSVVMGCLGSKSVHLSFTLVHPERTLDLECDSEANRNRFMEAFKVLTRKPEQIAAVNAAAEKAAAAAAAGSKPASAAAGSAALAGGSSAVVGSKQVAAALAAAPKTLSAAEQKRLDDDRKKKFDKIKQGGQFYKYKHRQPQKRIVWVNEPMDRVYWGEDNKNKVNGNIPVKEITGIHLGCAGSANMDLSFTLMHPERTLDLECSSKPMRDFWVNAFCLLTGKPLQS